MHITSIDRISIDGRLTDRTGDGYEWASEEDQDFFQEIVRQQDVLVMGRGTYEYVRPVPMPGLLRVVLTHHPDEYAAAHAPGQLEFLNLSAEALLANLEERGLNNVLLVGGQSNRQFFEKRLVNKMWIVTEPIILGGGQSLLDGLAGEQELLLTDQRDLNPRGTAAAYYTVDRFLPKD